MTKINQNISDWVGGDDKTIILPITNKDGDNVDTTGHTGRYVISKSPGGTVLISLTVATGEIIVATPTTEKVTIKVDGPSTKSLWGRYHHELELVDIVGAIYTAFVGSIYFRRNTA